MSDDQANKSATGRRRILRALWRIPLLVAATIYFLIDDVVLAAVRPIVAWAAELRPFQRLAAAIDRLPAYPTLILFLVPFALLEPVKIWALVLIGTGHLKLGGIVLAVAHLVSIVLVERLFHATRAKLLTIGWFAQAYGLVVRLYDMTVGRLRATPAWRAVAATLARIKAEVAGLVRRLGARLRRAG